MTELAAAPLRTPDLCVPEVCDNILYSDTRPADETRLMERVLYTYAATERYRQLAQCFFYALGLTKNLNDPLPETSPELNRTLIKFLEREGQIPRQINCHYLPICTEPVTNVLHRNVEMYITYHFRRDATRIYNPYGRLNAYAISYNNMDEQVSYATDHKGYCGVWLDEQGRVLARAKPKLDCSVDAMLAAAYSNCR
jgi:hypothetical protein